MRLKMNKTKQVILSCSVEPSLSLSQTPWMTWNKQSEKEGIYLGRRQWRGSQRELQGLMMSRFMWCCWVLDVKQESIPLSSPVLHLRSSVAWENCCVRRRVPINIRQVSACFSLRFFPGSHEALSSASRETTVHCHSVPSTIDGAGSACISHTHECAHHLACMARRAGRVWASC